MFLKIGDGGGQNFSKYSWKTFFFLEIDQPQRKILPNLRFSYSHGRKQSPSTNSWKEHEDDFGQIIAEIGILLLLSGGDGQGAPIYTNLIVTALGNAILGETG